MFRFLKEESIFEKHYRLFLSHPVINGRKYCQEITAAYLFILSDYVLLSKGEHDKRQENAHKIFDLLESKFLDSMEMDRFDKAVDLFASVLNGEIPVRGDWCLLDKKLSSGLQRVLYCYGDLIYAPDYIEDYQNSPVFISPIDLCMAFYSQFMEISKLSEDYMNKI